MGDKNIYEAWVAADQAMSRMRRERMRETERMWRNVMRFHIAMAILIVVICFGVAGACLADNQCRADIQHGNR
jgi:hypothetical protein